MKIIISIFSVLLLAVLVTLCTKDNITTDNQLSDLTKRTIDTTYVPLVWGSSLRITPRILLKGKYKKKDYWFAQTFAYSKIDPANYQQDSVRERAVVADTFLISQTDTFYICRRVIK